MFHLILDMPHLDPQVQADYATASQCQADGTLLVADLVIDNNPPSFRCVYYPGGNP